MGKIIMPRSLTRFALAGSICVLALGACVSRPIPVLPRASEDLTAVSARQLPLKSVLLIAEKDFQRLLQAGEEKLVSPARQVSAIELTAEANSPTALGVLGKIEPQATVNGDLFLVARDAALTSQGLVQAKSFYVASVPLSGRVSWVARAPSLIFNENALDAAHSLQGCAPIAGRDGVPDGIVLNLETSSRPANASGESIEVQLPSVGAPGSWNRLLCAGSVRIAADSPRPRQVSERPVFKSTMPFPEGAVAISEADFYRLLKTQTDSKISPDSKDAAARILTAAADPSAMGIEAQFDAESNATFSTSFVVVVRDPILHGTMLSAREFYIVPVDFAGTASWLGRDLKLGFFGDPPTSNLDDSFCGPRITLQREPNCSSGFCIGGRHQWMGSGRGIGGPAPGHFQPTIRLFGFNGGGINANDVIAIACTGRLAPPEREVYECGLPSGGRGPEICNGRDDDCNGQTDEGGVCDRVPMRCPAQPRTCGSVTCGDLPDGCGGVLHCGGPCP